MSLYHYCSAPTMLQWNNQGFHVLLELHNYYLLPYKSSLRLQEGRFKGSKTLETQTTFALTVKCSQTVAEMISAGHQKDWKHFLGIFFGVNWPFCNFWTRVFWHETRKIFSLWTQQYDLHYRLASICFMRTVDSTKAASQDPGEFLVGFLLQQSSKII